MKKTSLRDRLLQKGWPSEEVDYTLSVFNSGEEGKSRIMKILENIVYWVAIIIAILGNMIIAVVLIPFFLVLPAFFLYFIVIILGLGFGLLYEILIRDIERVTGREMIIESIFIPSLALISVSFMTYFGNVLARAWSLTTIHNPFLVGFLYALVFISPWIFTNYILKKGKYL